LLWGYLLNLLGRFRTVKSVLPDLAALLSAVTTSPAFSRSIVGISRPAGASARASASSSGALPKFYATRSAPRPQIASPDPGWTLRPGDPDNLEIQI
jgi:hypothetical protein